MATDIYRTDVTMDMQGQMASIVQTWKCIDPTSDNTMLIANNLINGLLDGIFPIGYINRLRALLSEDTFISSIRATRIFAGGGTGAVQVFQRDEHVGTIESTYHTGQLAGVVVWVTSSRPEVTGRNFIPGVPESMIEGGRFIDAYRTAIDNFVLTSITGFTTPETLFTPVVWDREAEAFYDIDDGYLSLKPGTQRRREKPI